MASAIQAPSQTSAESGPPPLTGGARVEVCIAGGGLAGLVAAYLLARERRSVMLLEDGPPGGTPGGAEVAHLACLIEHPYRDLERQHGEAGARLAAQSCDAAAGLIESVVHRERIACEFERLDGYALGTATADLYCEVEAAHRAGVHDAQVLDAPPIEQSAAQACMRYPGLLLLNPHRLAAGLTRAALREGARIHRGVRIRGLERGALATVVTEGGHRIEADLAVAPAGAAPAPRLVNVLALRVPRGAAARALYWDAASPTRCARLRTHPSGEVLLVGGFDAPRALEGWARALFPLAGDVVQRFTAALGTPAERFDVACAGEGGGTYACASRWGTMLARCAITGMAIRDFADGLASPTDAPGQLSACHAVRFEPAAPKGWQ